MPQIQSIGAHWRTRFLDEIENEHFYSVPQLPNVAEVVQIEGGESQIERLGTTGNSGPWEDHLQQATSGGQVNVNGLKLNSQNAPVLRWLMVVDSQLWAQQQQLMLKNYNETSQKIRHAQEAFELGLQKYWILSILQDSNVTADNASVTKFLYQMTDDEYLSALTKISSKYIETSGLASPANTFIVPLSESAGMASPIKNLGAYATREELAKAVLRVKDIIYTPDAAKTVNGTANYYAYYNKNAVSGAYWNRSNFGKPWITKPDINESKLSMSFGLCAAFSYPIFKLHRQKEGVIFAHTT